MKTIIPFLFALGLVLCFHCADSKILDAIESLWYGIQSASGKETCMPDLGCFGLTDDFKSLMNRPISVLPQDRVTIDTKFLLYTRKNPREAYRLRASDQDDMKNSPYDPKIPTKFICHGFMDSEIFGPWMVKMKDEFLMYSEYNVIVVDWSGGNKPPYYQATSNTRVVGAEIALMIQTMKKVYGIRFEDMHIIGHSLGSHVAGYAGERLKTLGRITGCDPAEPYFQNMPATVRLDPTDALHVDVIHSDAKSILLLGFGMSQACGHIDFYPNNGRDQPGCKTSKVTSFITDGLNEGLRRFASCNHQRSLDFMESSVNYHKVVPVGYQCSDWETFLDGKCADCGMDGQKCAIMGIRADEYKPKNKGTQAAFYLVTSGKIPFWLYHYQITVKFYKPKTDFKDQKGTMEINLHGAKEDYLVHFPDKIKSLDIIHGAQYKALATTPLELGEIKSVTVKWTSTKLAIPLLSKPKVYIEYIQVIPMNQIELSPRNMTGRVFCSNPGTAIEPQKIVNFQKDDKCMKYL